MQLSVSDFVSCIQRPFESSSSTCLAICSAMRCYACVDNKWQSAIVDCARQIGDSGVFDAAR